MTHTVQTNIDTDVNGAATTTLSATAGSNRIWLFGISHEQSGATTWINSFTIGGQTPTLYQRQSYGSGSFSYVEWYYLTDSQIAALSANPSISMGTPGNKYFAMTVFQLSGRNQNPANWNYNFNGNNTQTAVTFALTTGADVDVAAVITCTSGSASGAFSAGVTELTGSDRAFNGTGSRTLSGTATTNTNPLTITGDISSSSTSTYQLLGAVGVPPAVVDSTPPTISSVTLAANGTSLTITTSEAVQFGAGGNSGFTLSASGGSTSLSYSSGSGSSSLVYTSSRTIASGETLTLSYTQPGNGVEDVAGNDLATVSNRSVTNNSTQVSIPSGWSSVTVGSTIATSGYRVKGSPDIATGNIIAWGNVVGTGSVTVLSTGAYTYDQGVKSFDFQIYDGSWGSVGTIKVTARGSSGPTAIARRWISSKLQSIKYISRKN